jgi:hypothetical protein
MNSTLEILLLSFSFLRLRNSDLQEALGNINKNHNSEQFYPFGKCTLVACSLIHFLNAAHSAAFRAREQKGWCLLCQHSFFQDFGGSTTLYCSHWTAPLISDPQRRRPRNWHRFFKLCVSAVFFFFAIPFSYYSGVLIYKLSMRSTWWSTAATYQSLSLTIHWHSSLSTWGTMKMALTTR